MRAVSDDELADAVRRELERDPWLRQDARIGVAAGNGAITLTGYVVSPTQESAAVQAAQRVAGVEAVADDINVLNGPNAIEDTAIAARIAHARRRTALIPDSLGAEVRNGHVTLRGEVPSSSQRAGAERAVRSIAGVRAVTNVIAVAKRPDGVDS